MWDFLSVNFMVKKDGKSLHQLPHRQWAEKLNRQVIEKGI